jgi:asparagine synthetase B (glutamine-hydrolysing)
VCDLTVLNLLLFELFYLLVFPVPFHYFEAFVITIHYYDVLRVDRGISAFGLESRVPFLSHHFVDLYLSIDPSLRNPIKGERVEKYLLRNDKN